MGFTVQEVLQFVRENDVKFVRACVLRPQGKSKEYFDYGPGAEPGFRAGYFDRRFSHSRILQGGKVRSSAVPDPSTLTVIPWRPQHGRVVRVFAIFRGETGLLLRRTAAPF